MAPLPDQPTVPTGWQTCIDAFRCMRRYFQHLQHVSDIGALSRICIHVRPLHHLGARSQTDHRLLKLINRYLSKQRSYIGNSNTFPFRCIELRGAVGSTLPEAMKEYVSKITGNAIFAGQLTGTQIGEYAIFGQWWEGSAGMCILISVGGIILASKLYGNDEWTKRTIG